MKANWAHLANLALRSRGLRFAVLLVVGVAGVLLALRFWAWALSVVFGNVDFNGLM